MPTMTDDQRRRYRRTEVWARADDLKAIASLKIRYEKLVPNGPTITTTAVIRRAIRLLDQHMQRQNLLTPGPRLAEVAAMAEVINSP